MLIVVRHGRTAWNIEGRFQGWAGVGLDRTGFDQARRAAADLAAIVAPPVDIVASDLRRAVETAEVLAGRLRATLSTDPALREVDCGDWQGLTDDEVARKFPDEYDQWQAGDDVRRGGGETYAEAGARVAGAIDRIMRSPRPGPVVLVGHGKSLQWGLDTLVAAGRVDRPGPAPHLGNAEFLVLPDWRHDQTDGALPER